MDIYRLNALHNIHTIMEPKIPKTDGVVPSALFNTRVPAVPEHGFPALPDEKHLPSSPVGYVMLDTYTL